MGMKYNLLLSHKFDRDFSRLEKMFQNRVAEGLRELNDNPHAGKQLKGRLKVYCRGAWGNIVYYIIYRKKNYLFLLFLYATENMYMINGFLISSVHHVQAGASFSFAENLLKS